MNVIEPLNYDQAKYKEKWVNAMNEEYNSIMRNKTQELVELPKDKVPIGSKWLSKYKFKVDGTIEKLKERLVAKGYSQQEGNDFEETYPPRSVQANEGHFWHVRCNRKLKNQASLNLIVFFEILTQNILL